MSDSPFTPTLVADPLTVFDFALSALTWEHVRDLMPVDEAGRYWTLANCGPLSLLVRAATDHTACLADWTTREDSPGLFAAEDSAQLWHLGVIVEITCHGVLLAHESLWACCLDTRTATTERESYQHFVSVINQLTRQACYYLLSSISAKIQHLSGAANVLLGLEVLYTRTVGF